MYGTHYFFKLLLKVNFLNIFSKNPTTSNFMNIFQLQAELFNKEKETHRQTDVTALIVDFRAIAKRPRNWNHDKSL